SPSCPSPSLHLLQSDSSLLSPVGRSPQEFPLTAISSSVVPTGFATTRPCAAPSNSLMSSPSELPVLDQDGNTEYRPSFDISRSSPTDPSPSGDSSAPPRWAGIPNRRRVDVLTERARLWLCR